MIRINLLPVRAAKKKESLVLHLIATGVAIFIVVVAMSAVYVHALSNISDLNGKIAGANAELEELKKKVGVLENIRAEKEAIQKKLDVVTELEKGRSGPTDMFTLISNAIPKQAWIGSLNDSKTQLTVSGLAASEQVVSDFMTKLEGTGKFSRIDLTQTTSSSSGGRPTVSFSLILVKK